MGARELERETEHLEGAGCVGFSLKPKGTASAGGWEVYDVRNKSRSDPSIMFEPAVCQVLRPRRPK